MIFLMMEKRMRSSSMCLFLPFSSDISFFGVVIPFSASRQRKMLALQLEIPP